VEQELKTQDLLLVELTLRHYHAPKNIMVLLGQQVEL
jgi:hypothetical protein